MFTLLSGRLALKTPRNYPRPPEDALWLAASVTPAPGSQVLDAACGIGTVGLALKTRCPEMILTAVDLNPTLTRTAAQNAQLNKYDITTINSDILNHNPNSKYDYILCNPPFHEAAKGHTTPNPDQAGRHTMPEKLLQTWLAHFVTLLSPTGTIALILHTHQTTELAALASLHNLGGKLYPLRTAPDKKPKRLLALLTPTQPKITLCDIIPIHEAATRKAVLEDAESLL
jgi:tRNA1(Val) A37 N6-methylase TrmN6